MVAVDLLFGFENYAVLVYGENAVFALVFSSAEGAIVAKRLFCKTVSILVAAGAGDELIAVASKETQPLNLGGSLVFSVRKTVYESAVEGFLNINGNEGPAAQYACVVAANGTIGFVGLVVDKYGLFAVHLVFGILVHQGVVLKSLSFVGVAETERHKEYDGEGETVGMNVGHLSVAGARVCVSSHDLGRHVAHLSENAEVLLVGGNVVVVANKQVTGVGIEEEASVVQVLVGVSLFVESLEG